jgi:hypothetical protein
MILSISFFLPIYTQYKRFVRTIHYTGRYLSAGTKVALNNSFAIQVLTKRSIRASYYARPTANTLFHINADHASYRVFAHGTGKTRINTPRLVAIATLNGKRNLYIPLHTHAGQRTWRLFLKCLDEVLRLGLLHLTVNLTQATTNADLFLNIYSFHIPNSLGNTGLQYTPNGRDSQTVGMDG